MEIHKKESTIIRPAQETPRHCLWLPNLDQFPARHVPSVYLYRKPNDDCSNFFEAGLLKEALSKVLVIFYPVAGRLGRDENGRLEIKCNAEGVLFTVAQTSCVINHDSGDLFTPSLNLMQLVPTVDTNDISSYPLLLVQLTHFKCGGVSLGLCIHHNLGDGKAVLHFINTWADMTRGIPIKNPPFIDRTIVRAYIKKASLTFDHSEYDPPLYLNNEAGDQSTTPCGVASATLKLSHDQINNLKAKVNKDNVKYSTYEILAAYIWRCMCKARELSGDQSSRLHIIVDGRSRLNPPLPSEYFGNVIFRAAPIALSGDITSKPLIFTVKKIHEAINRRDDEYLKSALAYIEHKIDVTSFKIPYKKSDFKINSWAKMPIYDADFGWGRPIYMNRAKINSEGESYLLPSPTNDGSLSLIICLETRPMELFKKFFYEF